MATSDQVVISFGHVQYVMPAKAGMAVFAALAGEDIYIREERYESIGNKYEEVPYIKMVMQNNMPKLQHIGPVQFHIGLENQRVKDEQYAAKEAAKAKDA